MSGGRRWTPAEDAILVEAARRGVAGKAEYARLTVRSAESASSRLRYLRSIGLAPLPMKKTGRPRKVDPQAAAAKAPAGNPRAASIRRCLGCGFDFASTHAGNRICPRCAAKADRAGAGRLDTPATLRYH